MSEFVLDASVAVRLVRPSESGHDGAREVYAEALESGFAPIAPDIFLYETGHVLGRAGGPAAEHVRTLLGAYELVDVVRPSLEVLSRAAELRQTSGVSFYDASYVALAGDRGTVVWTEDRELVRRFPHIAVDTERLKARLKR